MALLQQILQLARTNPRLQQPLSFYQHQHLMFSHGNTLIALSLLVVRLLTQVQIPATLSDCKAIYLFFFDDLP